MRAVHLVIRSLNLVSLLCMVSISLCFFCEQAFGEEEEAFEWQIDEIIPEKQTFYERVSLLHIEGKGLGYSIGYSSLDLFLAKTFCNNTFVPFLDIRGHVFNNGRFAANAGLGLRYFSNCLQQIWGVNAFYDYLENARRSYHQVGAGIEILGNKWDFHCNAYVPFGCKKTNIYRFNYGFFEDLKRKNVSSLKFGLKAREQLALNSVDALFGYRFCNIYKNADMHIGAGPYYFWGNSAKTENAFTSKHQSAFGGRGVVDIYFNNYIALSGVVTYDSIFKWCGQGTITLNIPLDAIFRHCQPVCSLCSVKDRLFDSISRNEIIAIDYLSRFTNDPRVLDPEFQP